MQRGAEAITWTDHLEGQCNPRAKLMLRFLADTAKRGASPDGLFNVDTCHPLRASLRDHQFINLFYLFYDITSIKLLFQNLGL